MENIHLKADNIELRDQDKRSLFGFTFLHFMNDVHANALPTIIPMLVSSISMSLSQAGLLNAFYGLTNVFGQPVSGYFADRQKRPWLAVWGPMLSVIGACLLPLSTNYAFAVLLVGFISIGTVLFHPQGVGRCGSAAAGRDIAFFISLFSASGSLGSAIGPLYVVFMISLIGKKSFPLMILPVFLICLYLWVNIVSPQKTEDIKTEQAGITDFLKSIRKLMGKIGDIVLTTSIRDATLQGIKIFLPMLIITRGGTIQSGGFLLFAISLAATMAGIIGGRFADTLGDDRILIGSLSISPIFILLGLHTSGIFSICSLMLGFGFLQASSPVTTAMAQKRCPESRSAASSLSMGVSWGIANLAPFPVGLSADIIGLETTLRIVAFIPWAAVALYLIKSLQK